MHNLKGLGYIKGGTPNPKVAPASPNLSARTTAASLAQVLKFSDVSLGVLRMRPGHTIKIRFVNSSTLKLLLIMLIDKLTVHSRWTWS